MNPYKYNYNYGTSPYKLDERGIGSEGYKRQKLSRNKRKSKAQLLKARRENIKFATQMSLMGIVLFIFSFCYVGLISELNLKQKELKDITRQILDTQSAISSVEAQISEKFDLEVIKEKARLIGLEDPLPHQVVYIDIPKVSYTRYAD